jgi:hypothetical protein
MIWYSDITSCAGIDDEIVVIFEGTYKQAVKFKFIATGFMNRENLSYYSIPQGKRPRPTSYLDIRAHGREIEQYSTYSLSHHLPKVLVFPRSNNEASFLRNPPDWFDQESYLRIAYPGRRVNYYYECDPRIDRS